MDIDNDYLPVAKVLLEAAETKLQAAIVVGWDSDGAFYYNSTMPDGQEAVWLMEMAKKKLLEIGDADD